MNNAGRSGFLDLPIWEEERENWRTTLALNLADTVANDGGRVALLDGDLRDQSLTKLLAPNRNQWPAGDPSEDANLNVFRNANFAFHLLPSPARPDGQHPSEILCTTNVRELLERAKESFDLVIVDLPSVLDHPTCRPWAPA